MNNKTALITGASSGIGYELAKIFAKDGYNLVLVARNEQKLNQLKSELSGKHNITVKVLPKDLSKPHAAEEIFNEVKNESISIDVLVNNAGFGIFNDYWNTDYKKEQEMLQVNIMSLARLTNLFAKDMIKRGDGKILNVASTAAFQPGPMMAGYYASKSFVLSYSQAINFELKKRGVQVSTLCPGPTITEFQTRAGMGNINLFKKSLTMTAEQVAKIGYKGLMKGKPVIIAGITNKIGAMSSKWSPAKITLPLVKWLHKKK
ncbi:D-beta-hydroxybutyrate dehydrogenase [bacterium BMS3Abin03]|nr:D-beta-hydroxybutyrate dehydrogenase [bacterium BMS3Abin03]